MDPLSTALSALQLGSSLIQIGKIIGGALQQEDPTLALQLGISVGSLTTNADQAKRLLRRVKRTGKAKANSSILGEVEYIVAKILKDLGKMLGLILKILIKPSLFQRVFGRLGILRGPG